MSCKNLNSPTHGSVAGNGVSYKSVKTLTCNLGYILEGSKSRECLSNGSWSGTAGTCTGKMLHVCWLKNGEQREILSSKSGFTDNIINFMPPTYLELAG